MAPHNLADLTDEKREAIERDKRLWHRAHHWLKTQARKDIRRNLDALPLAEREDMRQRLNTIQENRRATRRAANS